MRYSYDPDGNRLRLIDPTGQLFRFTYDALNRLTQLQEGSTTLARFTYDALSRRTGLALADGTATTYQYDAVNQLLRQDAAIDQRAYTYDPLGNRLTLTDALGLHTYTYDALSQLIAIDEPAGSVFPDTTLTYDALGNRTQVMTTSATPYTTNALNQYTQIGSTALSYDLNGNLTGDGTRTLTYDSEHRLRSVAGPFGNARYTYDPLDRRLSTTVNGLTTRFLYDGDDLLAETDSAGLITATYLYGPEIDEPLRLTRGSQSAYYHADALGSIIALTDPTGAVLERASYEAFGTPQLVDPAGVPRATSAVGNRFLFTGREYDQDTGLYYDRYRTYNPILGRFHQRDPLGALPDLNLYRYAGNNPFLFTDPFGLDVWIEGPGPGERPRRHQSINVGDPNGEYDSYSFGVNGQYNLEYGIEGQVYRDPIKGGAVSSS